MNNRNKNQWTADFGAAQFEAVRRQRGHGRSHGREDGGFGWGGPAGGPPPWIGQMFGPQWGSPAGRGGRRTRVRRGDVRPAILDVLGAAADPLNGYQVIQQIAERSQGGWKPSPGSVYPTIAQLVDEGLVEDAPTGRKTLQLTGTGRAYLAANVEEIAAVWAPFDLADDERDLSLQQVIKQTVGAIVQVATAGTPAQQAKAVEILADTRRRLYGLLAEGPEAAEDE